jgi:hypothetical protein
MAIPRSFALAGIFGPLLFGLAVAFSAQLDPEYSHYSQFMSELGETGSRSQALMNFAGFLPAALLLLLASMALIDRFGATRAGTLGSACIAVFAVGMFVAGLFPCDPGCTPEVPSRSQRIHEIAGMFADPALALAPLILAFGFRRLAPWRSWFVISLATSLVSFCALIAMAWSLPERSGSGLFQRLAVGLPFLWLAIVCGRLWRSAAGRGPARP